jgi:hypothetical protein
MPASRPMRPDTGNMCDGGFTLSMKRSTHSSMSVISLHKTQNELPIHLCR